MQLLCLLDCKHKVLVVDATSFCMRFDSHTQASKSVQLPLRLWLLSTNIWHTTLQHTHCTTGELPVTVYENLESKGGVKTSAILDMNAKEVGALSGAHRLGEKV
jgi:hypothetical protein